MMFSDLLNLGENKQLLYAEYSRNANYADDLTNTNVRNSFKTTKYGLKAARRAPQFSKR